MAVNAPAQIDRQRIKELIEREEKALNDATHKSEEMYKRAHAVLTGGVASSYQLRDPWPIYLERGKGPKVWDVDGNEMYDFHNGFGSMVQGHAHPAIGKAIRERYDLGTHFAAPTEDAVIVAEELQTRWSLPRWRYTNSGSESTMDAIRIARAYTQRDTVMKIFGSYHGHHDTRDGLDRRRVRQDRRPREPRLAPLRRRHPAGRRRHDDRRAVQRRARDGAPDRAPHRGGPQARLRDHGGGDDEPRDRAPRARLPRGGPRDHRSATASS